MNISEIMRMIPDDGELSIKNNSGKVIIKVQLYDLYCESEIMLRDIDELLSREVERNVNAIIKKIHANS